MCIWESRWNVEYIFQTQFILFSNFSHTRCIKKYFVISGSYKDRLSYFKPLSRSFIVNANSPYHQKLAQAMRMRLRHRNLLQQRVEKGLLSTRSRLHQTIEDVNFDFPELSFDDLCLLFLGTYKIKLARGYVEEHFDQDGDFIVELDGNYDDILRCTIRSRHSNATKYKSWIQYSLSGDPIVAWYCTCPTAAPSRSELVHTLFRLFGIYHTLVIITSNR